uniref:Uncharacterized protein n=1 Tax=Theileria parva TaxID=5875 RepID=Q4MZT7_THEPA|eukprot:XP_763443.1 hypothetical protein [Theileria parva strain Muguga]
MKGECEVDTSSLTPPSKIKRSYNNGIAEYKLKKNGIDDGVVPKLSYKFKDKNIKLTPDRLSATGYKGWSSVFCTHCACTGKWYYEVKINQDYKNLKFVGHDNSFKHQIKGHVRYSSTCIISYIIVLEWVMHVDIRDMIHLLELIVTDSQFPTLMERLVIIQRNTPMPPHSMEYYVTLRIYHHPEQIPILLHNFQSTANYMINWILTYMMDIITQQFHFIWELLSQLI